VEEIPLTLTNKGNGPDLPSSALGHRFEASVIEPTNGSDEGKSSSNIF